jgi:RIO kinase 1
MSSDPKSLFEEAVKKTDGHAITYVSDIKSGKEAVVCKVLFDGELAAMKIYKDPEQRNFTQVGAYLAGKYYKHESERKAVAKNNSFGKKLKHDNWVKREFFLLQKLHKAGANIPKPIIQLGNAIVMELIGDQSSSAPRLSDVELNGKEAQQVLDKIVGSVKLFWKEGIVHGDLSAYNVLWWKSEPYIIDFPQSVDIRNHPNPEQLLERDMQNISKYFSKYFVVEIPRII